MYSVLDVVVLTVGCLGVADVLLRRLGHLADQAHQPASELQQEDKVDKLAKE